MEEGKHVGKKKENKKVEVRQNTVKYLSLLGQVDCKRISRYANIHYKYSPRSSDSLTHRKI